MSGMEKLTTKPVVGARLEVYADGELIGWAGRAADGVPFRAVRALETRWTGSVHGEAWPTLGALLACVAEVRALPGALEGDFFDEDFRALAYPIRVRHGAHGATRYGSGALARA